MADKEKEQTPRVTPLDGRTTLNDKMFFEPERLAYASSEDIADAIAEAVDKHLGTTNQRPVVITAGELLIDLSNLAAAEAMLASAKLQFQTCTQLGGAINSTADLIKAPLEGLAFTAAVAAVAPAVAPAVAALTSAITLVSLFRENVVLSGVTTEMDQLTFRILVAAKLRKKEIRVRLYDTELPSQAPGSSPLLTALQDAEMARSDAWKALAPHLAALAEGQAKLDAAARANPQNNAALDAAAKDVTAKRQKITPVTNLLERADAHLAGLRTHLEKVDEKTGMLTLGRLLRAEMVRAGGSFILHVGVVAAGGHHRVSNTLWRTSADVSAMGGAVARWALLEADGAFEAGGMFQARKGEAFPGA